MTHPPIVAFSAGNNLKVATRHSQSTRGTDDRNGNLHPVRTLTTPEHVAGRIDVRPSDSSALSDIQGARAAFQGGTLTGEKHASFGVAIIGSAASNAQGGRAVSMLQERLSAAVEFLDAGLRLASDDAALQRARAVADIAAADLRALYRARDKADMLLDAELLSVFVSSLLIGRLAPVVPAEWRPKVAAAAWRLLDVLVSDRTDSVSTESDLFILRVAGDALDAALQASGVRILKKLRKVKAGERLPIPWLSRRLKRARKGGMLRWSQRGALPTLNDLNSAAERIGGDGGTKVMLTLPVVSAEEPDRYRDGKGLLAARRRLGRWDYQRLWVPLIILVAAGAPLYLQLLVSEGPFEGSWHRLPLSISASDALATNVQLLATAATLMIALAVADRAVDPSHRIAVNRFWSVGTVGLWICGAVGTYLGVLQFVSRPLDSVPKATVILLLGLLTVLLAAGADSIKIDKNLQDSQVARDLEAIEKAFACWRREAPKDWSSTTLARNFGWLALYSLVAPTAAVLSPVLFSLWSHQLTASVARALLLSVGVIGLFALPAASAAGWAVYWNTVRYRSDLLLQQKLSATAGSGFLTVILMFFTLLLAVVAGLISRPIIGGAIGLASIGPALLLLLLNVWPRCWPHFPSRIARVIVQNERNRLRARLDTPQAR